MTEVPTWLYVIQCIISVIFVVLFAIFIFIGWASNSIEKHEECEEITHDGNGATFESNGENNVT